MKSIALAAAALAVAVTCASAQETIIKERDRPIVSVPPVGVEIGGRRDVTVEKRNVETTGQGGCDSKTVKKEGPEGSTTVRKERCD